MILGIDTSNYVTSIACVDKGKLIFDKRILLEVPYGEMGLRQSNALFQHLNNLPILFDSVGKLNDLDAICVSSRPRRVEGSYMPCFLAGLNFAKSLLGEKND